MSENDTAHSEKASGLTGTTRKRYGPRTLQGKIGLIMFAVIILFLTNFVFIRYHLDKIQDDAYVTDALGRQRMLTHLIGFQAEQIIDDDGVTREDLQATVHLYQASLDALKEGGAVPGITDEKPIRPLPEDMGPSLAKSETTWQQYKENAQHIIASTAISQAQQYVDNIEELAPRLIRENDDLVKEYTAISIRNERMLVLWTVISLLSSMTIIVAFYQGVKRHLTKPLRAIEHATRQVELGNYSVRADVKTGDELEDLAVAFNKAAERLSKVDNEHKELDKAKVVFLTMASHELRSPMTPIKAQLQMLIDGYFGKLTKQQKEAAIIALRNAKHLDIVIMDMLELSRIEAAKVNFTFAMTDISKEIGYLVKGMQDYMPEKHVKIHYSSQRIAPFECDIGRVTQALRNLITNAIKFSNDGDTVIVTVQDGPAEVMITVRDYGRGMNDETKARAFEPFYQEDSIYSREHGGTGLGLSISKGIVEMMGGKMWFESVQGKGTTFYITIPKNPPKNMNTVSLMLSSDERWKTMLHK